MDEASIFLEALQRPKPGERAAYLDQACAGNDDLRHGVEMLLKAHAQAGEFLNQPAANPVVTVDEPILSECPGTMIGPYKLMELIGEGGMGLVFVAEQQQPVRRKVALKVIKPGMDTRQVVARFEAERQALALMDHPNIAKVLDGGTTDSGRPYFVMELVKGVLITEYCDQNQVSIRQRLELFLSVCQAVQHAHQKGIIHRDLKPSNVLVMSHDGTPVVKIIDFGVAKAIGQQLTDKTIYTQFAQLIGTPLYMSPEQAGQSGLDVDTRSDIYSLGVLLYELLTGTTPFDRERLREVGYDEMRRIIREEEPPKPSTRISTLGKVATTVSTQRQSEPKQLSRLIRGELDWIVMKALEKDRNRRYETANSLARDIERYLHDEPVQACPPSTWYRFYKFARRNKGALAMVGLLAATLVLVVGVLAGSIGWIAKDQADRLAVTEERVTAALEDATELQKQMKWPEALEAVKRAEGILATGVSEELRERVGELAKDLRMVLDLEEIRLPRPVRGVEGDFDRVRADSSYAEKFRDYGIDIDALEPAEAAMRIRTRTIWPQLTVALDNWAAERRAIPNVKQTSWKRLLAVARAADPDEWRNRIREAIEPLQIEFLRKLAYSENIKELPVETLALLANAGGQRGIGKEQEFAVLRLAQSKFPGDFWINFKLAYTYDFSRPPYQQFDEAIRFYTAALAARPRNVPTHMYLGLALMHRGKFDEALARFRRALELKPDDAGLCNTQAWLLATCPEPKFRNANEAVQLSYQAIQQAPKRAEYWNTLGVAHFRARNWKEAITDLDKAEKLAPGKSFAWNAFFLAMAHWQLGDKELARKEYDQAVQWMRKTRPENEELRRFRAEAEELLQMHDPEAKDTKKNSSP